MKPALFVIGIAGLLGIVLLALDANWDRVRARVVPETGWRSDDYRQHGEVDGV